MHLKSASNHSHRPDKRKLCLWLATSFVALILSGCAYHLGPTNGVKAGAKTIQVHPFTNKTLQARVGDAVTAVLRKQLQQDGTYRLSTYGDTSDIVVSGVVTKYERHGMTYQSKDVVTVRDFRVTTTVHVIATERSTGNVIFDQNVIGTTLVRAGTDLNSDERQALPLLADNVAKKITALVVDGSW